MKWVNESRKGSMNQETITTLKDYAYNNRASKYIEIKTDITKKGKTDESTFITRDFNTFSQY